VNDDHAGQTHIPENSGQKDRDRVERGWTAKVNDSDEPSPGSDETPAHSFKIQPLFLLARLSLENSSIGDRVLSLVQEATLARAGRQEE
jgi:hypothetical protein